MLYLLVTLLPIIIYVIVDAVWGFRAGIVAAMVSIIATILFHYLLFDTIDQFIIGEGVFILVMGTLSLFLNNSHYFKLQPAIMGVIFSLILIWFEIFDEPFFIKMIPTSAKMLPEFAELLTSPQMQQAMARMSKVMIGVFLVHAGLVVWSALRWSNVGWLMSRLAIFPMALIASIVAAQF